MKHVAKSKFQVLFSIVNIYFYPIFLGVILVLSLSITFSLFSKSCIEKNEWCGQDMDQYMDYSTNMLTHHGFTASRVSNMYYISPTEHIYIPEILRLPAFPIILTLGRLLYNKTILLFIINLISFMGILFYSYLLLKRYVFRWGVLLGIALIGLSPTVIYYTGFMGNVDIFVCFVITAFIFHVTQVQHKDYFHIIMTTVFGLLTVFSRQNTLIIVFIPLMLLGVESYFKKRRRSLLSITIIFSIIFFGIFLWTVRNFSLTNKFTFSAASGNQLFIEHIYFTPFPTKESTILVRNIIENQYGEKYIEKRRHEGVSIPKAYTELDTHINKISWNYILHNPLVTIEQFFLEIKSIYTDKTFNWGEKDIFLSLSIYEKYIEWVLLIVSITFPLAFLIKKRHTSISLLTLWFSVILFVGGSAFYHGIVIGNRGTLPILPIIIVLSVYFIQSIIEKLSLIIKYEN